MKRSYILTFLILLLLYTCNQGIGGSLGMVFDIRQKFDFQRVHPTIGVRKNHLNLRLMSQKNRSRAPEELKNLAKEIDKYISVEYINATKNHQRSYTFQDTSQITIATIHFDRDGKYVEIEFPPSD